MNTSDSAELIKIIKFLSAIFLWEGDEAFNDHKADAL